MTTRWVLVAFLGFTALAVTFALWWRSRVAERREAEYLASYEASQRHSDAQREVDRRALANVEARERDRRQMVIEAEQAARRAIQERQEQEARRFAETRTREEAARLEQLREAIESARASDQGCKEFETVGPRAVDQRQVEPLTNPCGEGIVHVTCREVSGGWFVPVSVRPEECTWRLWFVPSDASAAPVASEAEYYEEFDLALTRAAYVDRFEDEDELVVVRGFEHPEGVSSSSTVIRHLRDGRVLELPFDTLRDEDGDGALDGILEFQKEEDDICNLDNDVWARISHRAPALMAHRSKGMGFSLSDEVARAWRQNACLESTGPVVVIAPDGQVDDGATARNVVCRAANGDPIAEIEAELERDCLERGPEDCPNRRPRTCWQRTLLGWLHRIDAVQRLAAHD